MGVIGGAEVKRRRELQAMGAITVEQQEEEEEEDEEEEEEEEEEDVGGEGGESDDAEINELFEIREEEEEEYEFEEPGGQYGADWGGCQGGTEGVGIREEEGDEEEDEWQRGEEDDEEEEDMDAAFADGKKLRYLNDLGEHVEVEGGEEEDEEEMYDEQDACQAMRRVSDLFSPPGEGACADRVLKPVDGCQVSRADWVQRLSWCSKRPRRSDATSPSGGGKGVSGALMGRDRQGGSRAWERALQAIVAVPGQEGCGGGAGGREGREGGMSNGPPEGHGQAGNEAVVEGLGVEEGEGEACVLGRWWMGSSCLTLGGGECCLGGSTRRRERRQRGSATAGRMRGQRSTCFRAEVRR